MDDGNIIRRAWLKYYDTAKSNYEELIISLDASFKGNDDSDYCAFTIWGRIGADKYLIDVVREKLNFPQTVEVLRQLVAKFPKATAKLIEDKANGSAIIDFLKREISGIVPVTPHESKIARLFAVSPQFEAGNVFLPSEKLCPLIFDYVNELTSFPNSKNDDMADSTSQALNYFETRTPFYIGRA
jgi:predicted phage terminase large subunit-like protein